MAPYSIIAQSRFFMRRTLKTLMKIRSVFPLAMLLALYAHWGGPLLCLANCNRGQGSMTLQPNLPRPFRPMRIICPVTAITPFWLARCIKWSCISFTVLKPAPQAIFPADFGWTPDYCKARERVGSLYHNLGSITRAGVAEISNQME